jgi:cytoskeletal protein CcmA (bactofilin family)
MFNKKEDRKVSSNTNQSPSLNMISEGTSLKGNIKSNSDIRVAGTIEGEAISKGKMIVISSGKVEGNVKAADADIAGRIEGEVRVSNKLILRQTAVIDGTIFTKTLIVEEGAQINGSCKMGTEINNISKSADSDFEQATKLKTEQA